MFYNIKIICIYQKKIRKFAHINMKTTYLLNAPWFV